MNLKLLKILGMFIIGGIILALGSAVLLPTVTDEEALSTAAGR